MSELTKRLGLKIGAGEKITTHRLKRLYKQFESINKIQSVPNYIDPAFYSNTHKHRLIDGARTCKVTFTGELFKASGYVAHDYESVVYFYASHNDLF